MTVHAVEVGRQLFDMDVADHGDAGQSDPLVARTTGDK